MPHSWRCPKRANPFQYESLIDGIWMDTSYDPEAMTTLRVPFLSADYFTLADSRSELGDAFALGQNVIIVVEGVAYEVVGAEDLGDDIILPKVQDELEIGDNPDPQSVPQSPSNEVENSRGGFCPGAAITSMIACIPLINLSKKRPFNR
ncbi:MAG: hypothetical protein IMY80_02365 [Chloroflexi bacterium]|nr:hypothetical protein [Chloroflexota bacterium]